MYDAPDVTRSNDMIGSAARKIISDTNPMVTLRVDELLLNQLRDT